MNAISIIWPLVTIPPASTHISITVADLRLASRPLLYRPETIFYIVEDQMSPEDAELMKKFVHLKKEDNEARQLRASHSKSQVRVGVVKITEHPEDKLKGKMIQQYAGVTLESTSPAEPSDTESSSWSPYHT